MRRIACAYAATRDPDLLARAARMRQCGASWTVQAHVLQPERSRPVPMRCPDRLCPACATARAQRWHELVSVIAADCELRGRRLRFITLTQRADPAEGPAAARARLQASVQRRRRMRRFRAWLGEDGGGLGRFEETWRDGRGRHSHAHA